MQTLRIFRETAAPTTWQAYAIYIIAPAAKPNFIELYTTSSTGEPKRIINHADIEAMIQSAISASNELTIVATIAARNALTPTRNMFVFVTDATGDATVKSGGATYLYNMSNATWAKVSEAESLDIASSWSSIDGRPNSAVADIDDAVSKRHAHANMTQLNKIGENASGQLTYGGSLPVTAWSSVGW